MRTGDLMLVPRHVSSHVTKINGYRLHGDATPKLDLSIPCGSNVGHYFICQLLICISINRIVEKPYSVTDLFAILVQVICLI